MLKEVRYYWGREIDNKTYGLVDNNKFRKYLSEYTILSNKFAIGSDHGCQRLLSKDLKFIKFFKSKFRANLYKFFVNFTYEFKLIKVEYIGQVRNQSEED